MHEVDTGFAGIEADCVSVVDVEAVVCHFDLATADSDVNEFFLFLMVMEVVLGEPFAGLKDGDVNIERIDT